MTETAPAPAAPGTRAHGLAVAAVAAVACAIALAGCGSLLDRTAVEGRDVTSRSGAFAVTVPEGYTDVDISAQPEAIDVAVQKGDPEQIIISRFDGADTAGGEGLHTVTSNVTQFQLDCQPLEDTLGADKAWSCTGEDQGHAMEKVYLAIPGEGESLLLLVQGAAGEPQGIARNITASIEWK